MPVTEIKSEKGIKPPLHVRKMSCPTIVLLCITLPLILILLFIALFKWNMIDIVIPFAGPIGSPKLEKSSWTSVTVSYKIVLESGNVERKIEIGDEGVADLHKLFQTQKSSGWALGTPCSSTLKTSFRHWYWQFGTPTHLEISRISNTDYGYVVDLTSRAFYDAVRKICVKKEQTEYPGIAPENIQLLYYRNDSEILRPYCPP